MTAIKKSLQKDSQDERGITDSKKESAEQNVEPAKKHLEQVREKDRNDDARGRWRTRTDANSIETDEKIAAYEGPATHEDIEAYENVKSDSAMVPSSSDGEHLPSMRTRRSPSMESLTVTVPN